MSLHTSSEWGTLTVEKQQQCENSKDRGADVVEKRGGEERGRIYRHQFLLLAAGCPERSTLPQHSLRQKRLEKEVYQQGWAKSSACQPVTQLSAVMFFSFT
jgi:hypothetical protein